jgi:NADH:ubiquinone oxidoreductase subunit E
MNFTVRICQGVECQNCGGDDLLKDAKKWAEHRKHITVEKRHCMSLCEKAPNVQVTDETGKEVARYVRVDSKEMQRIIEAL